MRSLLVSWDGLVMIAELTRNICLFWLLMTPSLLKLLKNSGEWDALVSAEIQSPHPWLSAAQLYALFTSVFHIRIFYLAFRAFII